ncbi:MAG: NAD(P)H-hydrate dehydratase [Nanoarchaeota archaeon]|nr:NAD(P)H-hydrate dehydratase [Nanoarchaeota archaeon]
MKYIAKRDIKVPNRSSRSHKGDNGKVLVIGGSRDYVGAVALAGMAALRSGVDWVTIAAPEKVGYAINALSSDLVVKKYKGDDFCVSRAKDILKFSKGFDSVLIGNGIGMNCKSFVRKYVKDATKNLVIDADAIKHISLDNVSDCILTPHLRELEILLDNSLSGKPIIVKSIKKEKNIEKISSLVKKILNDKKLRNKKIVILLKGKVDAIISKDKIKYNKTGNAGMTKAGTGDVLAGLCLGFVGQGVSLFQSASNAAYYNGLAGDILLKKKKGFTYLASDLVEEIRGILRE